MYLYSILTSNIKNTVDFYPLLCALISLTAHPCWQPLKSFEGATSRPGPQTILDGPYRTDDLMIAHNEREEKLDHVRCQSMVESALNTWHDQSRFKLAK